MNILEKFNLEDTGIYPIRVPNFGRNQMAELFAQEGFNLGVELGVADGTYSAVLCKANPNLRLYGVDPYCPMPGYRDYTKPATFEGMVNHAEEALAPYMDRYTFISKTSLDAAKDFEDGSLDFVYIDADHDFRHVTEDLDTWIKKVRKGGVIYGHDYAKTKGVARMHVKHVLDAYTYAWGIKPWFVLGNDANDEGLIRDSARSWLICV